MTIGIDRRTTLRYLRMQAPMFDDDQDKGGGGSEVDDDGKGKPDKKPAANDDRKGDPDFKPITTQDDLDAVLIPRLKRLEKSIYKQAKEELEAEAKAEAAKEQGDYKTLYEKAKEELDARKAEDAKRDYEDLKRKVATKVGLPDEAIPRISGETEEDLEKDAKALLKLLGPKKEAEEEDDDLGNSNKPRRGPAKPADDDAWRKPEHWLGN